MGEVFEILSNRLIRKRARRVYWRSFGWILLASIVMLALEAVVINFPSSLVFAAIMNANVDSEVIRTLGNSMNIAVQMVLQFVFSPVLIGGAFLFAARLWRGERARIGSLFGMVRRAPRVWAVDLVISLATYLPALIGLAIPLGFILVDAFVGTKVVVAIVLAMILMLTLMFVFLLRLSLSTGCMVLDDGLTAIGCIRTSWRASKSHLWRIFCHALISSLPFIAAIIAANAIRSDVFFYTSAPGFICYSGAMLLARLAHIYILLANVGLTEQLTRESD